LNHVKRDETTCDYRQPPTRMPRAFAELSTSSFRGPSLWRSALCSAVVLASAGGCGSGREGAPESPPNLEGMPGPMPSGEPGSPAAEQSPTTSRGSEESPLDCSAPRAAAVRLRLLSESQYNNSVLDLLRVGGSPGQGFGSKVFAALDDTRVEERANAAAAVASQAMANLAAWAPCVPPATGSSADCEQQIIDEIGAKAYRRPLSDLDRTELQALFDAGIAENGFATGVEWFLTGLLQSPDFMYEVVRAEPNEVPGEVRPLSNHEYATRMAFFIWDGPPDDELTAAAENGELSDPTRVQAQLARMIEDPRSSRGISQFYSRWLNLHAFGELARDDPGFDQNVVTALATSLLMSATELYASDNPTISGLFSGESYYFNDVLRDFYGVSGSGTDFTLAAMEGESRRGILTHPALMALMARPAESFPIGRGLFILRTVLCQNIPPPPAGFVIPQLPGVQEGVSTRQRLDMHVSNPVCNTCHSMIDPAGFAFESFDEVGRFRTIDSGVPVDTSGTLTINGDVDGAFATGDEFLDKLANSADVKICFAEKYLNFALSREETHPADACTIRALGESFASVGDLEQLVASVAVSDSFRLRLTEGDDL
jgi:hypothetical protein